MSTVAPVFFLYQISFYSWDREALSQPPIFEQLVWKDIFAGLDARRFRFPRRLPRDKTSYPEGGVRVSRVGLARVGYGYRLGINSGSRCLPGCGGVTAFLSV